MSNKLNSLSKIIASKIKTNGPIGIAEYQKLCLMHPEFGYYSRKSQIFGKNGDFITAPEVSQIFGEMIGVFVANWIRNLSTKVANCTFDIVEAGPGRGTLALDLTRTFSKLTPRQVNKYYLVECSEELARQQAKLLASLPIVEHISHLSHLKPDSKIKIVIANEFFDALPTSLIEYQRRIPSHNNNTTKFIFHELKIPNFPPTHLQSSSSNNEPTEASLWCEKNEHFISPHLEKIQNANSNEDNNHFELSIESIQACKQICNLLRHSPAGSIALIIDYGEASTPIVKNSFRAVSKHQFTNPFQNPGEHDITSNVNFPLLTYVAKASGGIRVSRCITQGEFLLNLGIRQRSERLNCPEALHKLVHKDEMGSLFKVLCLGNSSELPYPFEEEK